MASGARDDRRHKGLVIFALPPSSPSARSRPTIGRARREKVSEDGAVTVVVARFEGLMGSGLTAALRGDRYVQVLASDLAGVALERAIARRRPRVAIFDEGVDYAYLASLGSHEPAISAVVLVHSPSQALGTALLAIGVTCLPRAASPTELLAAVHGVAQG